VQSIYQLYNEKKPDLQDQAFSVVHKPEKEMNMNTMTQFNHNQKSMSSPSASECFLLVKEKIKKGQELSFAEQCVLMVASTAMAPCAGIKPTQEYFHQQQKNQPTNIHPIMENFIKAFPTMDDVRNAECFQMILDAGDRAEQRKKTYARTKTYIIRKQGTNEVKIGRSAKAHERINALKNQSGCEMEILCILEKDIESMLHKQFCNLRTVGEWFDDSQGLIAAFAAKQGGQS
jgi:hypothetical protein